MKRTPAIKTKEYKEKGRTIKQILIVANERGDKEWVDYLKGKK